MRKLVRLFVRGWRDPELGPHMQRIALLYAAAMFAILLWALGVLRERPKAPEGEKAAEAVHENLGR